MKSTVSARPSLRRRWTVIAAGTVALLASFAVTAPAQAGYYEDSNYGAYRCGYRCGYPAYGYPAYRRHYGCYGCGSRLIYERRYVEREYVERRYGYGGYRRHYGYYPYRRHYGYYPYGSDGSGYGYGGVGRRWPTPFLDGSYEGYEEPPRPPAPVLDEGDY
jgi:hypothetical protein